MVVCVGRHGGGGHCLAFAGERFVGLVAEDIQEGDRRGDFRDPTDVDVGGLRAKPAILAAGS